MGDVSFRGNRACRIFCSGLYADTFFNGFVPCRRLGRLVFIYASECAGVRRRAADFYPRGVGGADVIAADVGAGRDAHLA